MKSGLFIIFAVVSLVLCALAIAISIRSFAITDHVTFRRLEVCDFRGSVFFSIGASDHDDGFNIRSGENGDEDALWDMAQRTMHFAGFGWSKVDFGSFGGSIHTVAVPL